MTRESSNARRISVVGCSGTGKTTLARRIASDWGLARLELDGLHHQPDWTPLAPDALRARVIEFLDANESWVIDGNYSQVRDLVWARATTVAIMDIERWRMMWRLLWRTLRRMATGEELWNGNREEWRNLFSLDRERSILLWGWTKHPEYRAEYEALAQAARWSHLDFRRLGSSRDVERWFAECREPPGVDSPGVL